MGDSLTINFASISHLFDLVLPAVCGVDTVSVPDVILVHVLPAVIVPALVPAHLTVVDQRVACTGYGVTQQQLQSKLNMEIRGPLKIFEPKVSLPLMAITVLY